MKILYGTGNPAKLEAMRSRLENLDIELIGLNELKAEGHMIPNIQENGNTPLENARQKALAYYEAFKIPVFSCDSGLYFDNVPDEVQPGVHVRNVKGNCLSDEEMMEYYGGLVKKYGNLTARYKNAICFVMDENNIYEAMEPSMESEKFILTDVPHSTIRKKGFPLDSMSIDIKTNMYYYDLPAEKLEQVAVEDGFLIFFQKVLSSDQKVDIDKMTDRRRTNMKDTNCGYCMRGELLDKFGIFICDLTVSSLILFKEQSKPGRCIVAYKDHVSEIIDIGEEERNAFMADVAHAARALHAAFHPDKVNYGAYGDTGCHLHMHLVPKYKGGDEWGGTFQMNPDKTYLTDAEYREMIEKIKANL